MKITKIGHCCLLIELPGAVVLTDPGSFTTEQNSLTNIDVVLISHEHGDHYHIESLKEIVKNNPNVEIITNAAVGKLLDAEGLKHVVLDGTMGMTVKGVAIEAFDARHEEIYEDLGQVQNTAYFIDKLFYPGDAFAIPGRQVDILALPVAGPWCKIGDAIRYALKVKPSAAFPVHDAVLAPELRKNFQKWPQMILEQNKIKFISLDNGESHEF